LKFRQKFTVVSLLPFALAALLIVGAASLSAQEQPGDTAAQPAPKQIAKEVAKQDAEANSHKPVKYQKEESEDIFRHTKLVESIGKALHLDVETTARIFEWINFGVVFLAILIPLAKFLPKVLRKRKETLNSDLDEARKMTADANSRLSAVEAQLAKLDDEIAKFRTQMESELKNDEARIKSSLAEESARIVAAAEQEISVAAAQAQRGLKAFAADLAIDQAVKQLTLTAENDEALIEEFVADAGRGGKN
jgi:F-type H+-transporting ATPase subunit b